MDELLEWIRERIKEQQSEWSWEKSGCPSKVYENGVIKILAWNEVIDKIKELKGRE